MGSLEKFSARHGVGVAPGRDPERITCALYRIINKKICGIITNNCYIIRIVPRFPFSKMPAKPCRYCVCPCF